MAAIYHKSWGSRHGATSLPLSILLFPSLSWTTQGVCAELAHPLPNILMQFMQSNRFIKSTLMFNVLPGTLVQKSACIQNSATVGKTDAMDYVPCIACMPLYGTKKWGVRAHLDPHTARKWGVRTPGPHRIAATAS